jgi:hypothetical protein
MGNYEQAERSIDYETGNNNKVGREEPISFTPEVLGRVIYVVKV